MRDDTRAMALEPTVREVMKGNMDMHGDIHAWTA